MSNQQGTSKRFKVPSMLQCSMMIFVLKAALRICGFGRVTAWLKRRVGAIPAVTELALEELHATECAVATAAALYPGRALCLEQSLVLYYLLRRRGVDVKYCHGVAAHPFQAHAWIEYRGEVINDVPEHAKQFVRLPTCLT